MVLATADSNSKPSVRVVLLKGLDNEGFTFFTNYKSRKGKEIHKNKFGSLLFYWAALERQVRIEGKIKKISRTESQKYFDTRPLYSRLAAWASAQSKIIPDREYLELQFHKYGKKFNRKKIPIPPDWGGYKLIPNYFEFWQGRENRLHDRIAYRGKKGKWKLVRLAP
jgi:pyridoxamine 5'-phosphate oxidase